MPEIEIADTSPDDIEAELGELREGLDGVIPPEVPDRNVLIGSDCVELSAVATTQATVHAS